MRNELNDLIETTAKQIPDLNVREKFLDMSSLYDATYNIKKNLPADVKVET